MAHAARARSADPRNPPLDEATLVARARAGDREAAGELFTRHVAATRRLVLAVVGPRAPLDDLVQEIFLGAFLALARFRGEAAFATFLHRIAVRTCIDELRRRRRSREDPGPVADTRSDRRGPDDELAAGELLVALDRLLGGLTPKRRVALALFVLEGRSLREIAALVGVPVAVVKSRIFFARRELLRQAADDAVLGPIVREVMTHGQR